MFQHIKELAALSMRPGDDLKSILDKIKDIYVRMAAAGSNVSQMQHCTKIISVLDNLIPTLNTLQDQWTPEWLRQQILQEDFRRCHTGGGAANKTAEGYGAAGGSRGRGGGRGRGRGTGFGRGRDRGDYNEGHGSSGGRGNTRMEGACWYWKKAGHPWFKCFSRPEGWAPPGMKLPIGKRARGGDVQGSGAQGDGAHRKADPGMFLMVEDVKGSEGDVGSVGKVVMQPLTHWVINSGCTSHMTPRADLLDEVKPPGNIKFVAATSGALLPDQGGAEKLHRREVQCLELNQRHHVMHLLPEVDCGPKAWTVLKELHAPTSVVATLMLERELSALRLSDGEPVQPVLDKMRNLYAKLQTAGITYPEQI
ncbi:unnamed protein product, partial [Closterium sp. NIES-53]